MKTTVTQRTEIGIEDFNNLLIANPQKISKLLEGKDPKVSYEIREVGDDFMDRYSGVQKVTKVILTVKKDQ